MGREMEGGATEREGGAMAGGLAGPGAGTREQGKPGVLLRRRSPFMIAGTPHGARVGAAVQAGGGVGGGGGGGGGGGEGFGGDCVHRCGDPGGSSSQGARRWGVPGGEADTWGERYVQLLTFVRDHGAAAAADDSILGPWLEAQREVFATLKLRNSLTPELQEKEAMLQAVMLGKVAGEREAAPAGSAAQRMSQQLSGKGLVGAVVKKEFPGHGVYRGRITGYFIITEKTVGEGDRGYYHLVYEDNDEEDISEHELESLLECVVDEPPRSDQPGGRGSAAAGVAAAEGAEWEHNYAALAGFVREH
jgi:hypothetical protein